MRHAGSLEKSGAIGESRLRRPIAKLRRKVSVQWRRALDRFSSGTDRPVGPQPTDPSSTEAGTVQEAKALGRPELGDRKEA